ncbi:MAG: SOS response-associated peptidase, partial [Candidatus Limnocylindrales bacterium]
MCGRFTQQRPAPELAELFKAEPLVEETGPRFNVAPSQGVIAVVRPPKDERLLTTFRWGLIPSWASDTKIGYRLINARAESIFTSPAFRTSIRHKRCLIPVDAFYEWQRRNDAPKQPYAVHRRDGAPMALAGIW